VSRNCSLRFLGFQQIGPRASTLVNHWRVCEARPQIPPAKSNVGPNRTRYAFFNNFKQ
jgi:hypothetical protein